MPTLYLISMKSGQLFSGNRDFLEYVFLRKMFLLLNTKGGLFLLQSVSKIKQEQFHNPLMCKLWPYLKFISAISESSHSVNIEGVFSLADSGNSLFYASGMDFFVSFPAVI